MNEYNMTHEQHVKAVRSTTIKTKLILQCWPCEIRINIHMKHCLEFWKTNHDKQPSIDPFGMIQCILAYVTKGNKCQYAMCLARSKKWKYASEDISQKYG